MHRSGTSVTARLVRDLGWSLGDDDLLLGPREDNQDGFFERADVQVLNDAIFEHLDSSWDAPPSSEELLSRLDPGWVSDIEKLVATITDQVGGSRFAIKDPRLCVLWDLWAPALPDDLVTVLPIRQPTEVARSLHARDGLPLHMGLALWEAYMLRVAQARAGQQVVVVRYDQLLQRPEDSVRALATALGAEQPLTDIWTTVRRDYRRSVTQRDDERLLTPSQLQLWEWIGSLPDGSQELSQPSFPLAPSSSTQDLLRDRRRTVQMGRRAEAADAHVLALNRDLHAKSSELELLRVALEEARSQAEATSVEWGRERDHLIASLRAARHDTDTRATQLQAAMTALDDLRLEHERARADSEERAVELDAVRTERDQAQHLVEVLRLRRLAQAQSSREIEEKLELELQKSERATQHILEERQRLERSVQDSAAAVVAAHVQSRILEFQRDNLAASLVLVEGQRRSLERTLQEVYGSRVWRFGRWLTAPLRALRGRLRSGTHVGRERP
jgi:hypothetical protein